MTATKPICDATTGTCVACTSDDQCVAKLNSPEPGVCMFHQDGRCATVDETIYVQSDSTVCSDTATSDPGFGTVRKPLCTMQPVPSLLSASKDLVVVRGTVPAGTASFSGQGAAQTTIVGQNNAQIGSVGSPALTVQSGSLYVRGVEFSSTGSTCVSMSGGTVMLADLTIDNCKQGGINATGGVLNTQHVAVDTCAGGGIFLNGAAFDIEDTTVTNNGPGAQGTSGGVIVSSLSAGGPAILHLVTIEKNKQIGVTCAASAPVTATGVFAAENAGGDVAQTCGFSSCTGRSATCGAQ